MKKKVFDNDWQEVIGEEFSKPYFNRLRVFLIKEYKGPVPIYPEKKDILNALYYTPYSKVKAVILGQDPYHGPGQAHGLSFSVKPGVPLPPSLKNIFLELQADLGYPPPNHGYLKKWADEGVLLLNTVLTVRQGQANSHRGMGWEIFTDQIIRKLNEREDPVIFILWGRPARSKKALIDQSRHVIIESAHPSPLSASRGFFGSRPFSKTNAILRRWGKEEIDWRIEDLPVAGSGSFEKTGNIY